jgi:fatty-acyl-CoA synthase
MMDVDLSLTMLLDRAGKLFGENTITERTSDGYKQCSYADLQVRVRLLADALTRLGVRPGDRVASYAWNTVDHLLLYYAVPAIGAVLHTVNIRLSGEDVGYLLNDAHDVLLFCDASLSQGLPDMHAGMRAVITTGDSRPANGAATSMANLLADADPNFEFHSVDEDSAAILCYTSGTTGRPKGVAYSHRSICLYALMANQPDSFGLQECDVVMPIVPMFHANAWGLPFIATMTGANLVLPGASPSASDLIELIERHRVTIAAAVPTVWHDVLTAATREQLSSIRELIAGGAAVPEATIRAFDKKFGIPIVQGWGMTETSPLAAIARVSSDVGDDAAYALRAHQGRPIPFVDVRLDADAGGELLVRGPTVAAGYLHGVSPTSVTHDGWLRTGDIAEIDDAGYIRLWDRAKDLVKSGGEWISSVALENAVLNHPSIDEAAVVAQPHPKWGERPLLFAVASVGAPVQASDIRSFLTDRFPRWWVPDTVRFVDTIPKTSVGKIDKKLLRAMLTSEDFQPHASDAAAVAPESS